MTSPLHVTRGKVCTAIGMVGQFCIPLLCSFSVLFWKQKGGGTSAEGAEGVGCGEGVSPPHWGTGLGRAVPLLRFFFLFLELKIASFAEF